MKVSQNYEKAFVLQIASPHLSPKRRRQAGSMVGYSGRGWFPFRHGCLNPTLREQY